MQHTSHHTAKLRQGKLPIALYPAEGLSKSSILPTVTIGIPAYNEQYNIGNILKQVIQQKQEGFVVEKIIVASDGSTDSTVEIVHEYADKGVIVIDGKENYGQSNRQNEIMSHTSSDILVLLNADILLGDDDVIFHLVSPLLTGVADLTAQWAKPLAPRTFLERILCAGFELKYFIYTRHKEGNNIYTCVGHMRALSRRFYQHVVFPPVSAGEDQYLYLACIAGGYRYKHASDVQAFFRLPCTWSDYKKYAIRIFQAQRKYGDVCSEQVANKERHLPLSVTIPGVTYAVIRNPITTLLYILLHIIMQQWALKQSASFVHTFDGLLSTKKLLK